MPQFKGVWKEKNRWLARISEDGKQRRIGTFDTAEEAARAYDVEAKRLGKELNFPEETMPDLQIVEWHPYAKTFPLLDGDDYIDFRESIRNDGQDKPILARMANRRVQGLDGQNRLKACQEIGVEPRIELVRVEDDKVVDFIDRHNVLRRHMTREMRQARVEYLRSEGRSIRDIADRVGASTATVHRDLEASEEAGVTNVTPGTDNGEELDYSGREAEEEPALPAKVTGRDGKAYPASQPKKICDRCERKARVGQPKMQNCPDCKYLNRARGGKGRKPTQADPPNGSVTWTIKPFEDLHTRLTAEVVTMGKYFQATNTPALAGLHRKLKEVLKDVKEVAKTLTKAAKE